MADRTRRQGRIEVPYTDFSGGILEWISPLWVGDKYVTFSRNIDIQKPGTVRKRSGYSQLGTTGTSGRIKGLTLLEQADGTKTVVKAHGTNLYKYSASTWTSIYSGLTSTVTDKVFGANAFIDGEDRVYVVSGHSNDVVYWNGTTTGTVPTFRAYTVALYKNRLYFGNTKYGSNTFPNRVSFFDEGEDVVVDNNFFDDMGEPITALHNYAGNLYVFTANRIGQFDGYSLVMIPIESGTVAQRSVQTASSRLFWYNRNGVYMFAGEGLPTLVSRPIQDIIDAVSDASAVSGRVDKNGRYCLYLGSLTYDGTYYTNVEVIYDPSMNSWSFDDNKPFIVSLRVAENGEIKSIAGDVSNDKVYLCDSTTQDLGSNIGWEFITAKLDLEQPEDLKNFYVARFVYKPSATNEYITVQYRLDGDSPWTTVDGTSSNVSLVSSSDIVTTDVRLPKETQSRFIQFKLSHSGTASDFELYQIKIECDILRS